MKKTNLLKYINDYIVVEFIDSDNPFSIQDYIELQKIKDCREELRSMFTRFCERPKSLNSLPLNQTIELYDIYDDKNFDYLDYRLTMPEHDSEYDEQTKKWKKNRRKEKCLLLWRIYCKELMPLMKGINKGDRIATLLLVESVRPFNWLWMSYPDCNQHFIYSLYNLEYYKLLIKENNDDFGWEKILNTKGILLKDYQDEHYGEIPKPNIDDKIRKFFCSQDNYRKKRKNGQK